jgi:hypothetical protein
MSFLSRPTLRGDYREDHMTNVTQEQQELMDACQKRSVSVGNGEVIIELYYGSAVVGEIHTNNGTQEGDVAGEVNQIRLNYNSLSEIPEAAPEWTCGCCGYEIAAFDAIYLAEYPNSAGIHLGQLIDEHTAEHETEDTINVFVKRRRKRLSPKGMQILKDRYKTDDIDRAIELEGFEKGVLEYYDFNKRVYLKW